MTSLPDLVKNRYQNYWEARAKVEGRPEWATKPPLTMASTSAVTDLWPLALERYKRLLFTRGNLAMKPSAYWGTFKYPVDKCERGNTYLQVLWITHFGDTPIYEVNLRFGYHFEGRYIGNQALTLYNGDQVNRSVSLVDYAETGYEGHRYKGRDAKDEDVEWFSTILENYWPLRNIDELPEYNQLPQHPNG